MIAATLNHQTTKDWRPIVLALAVHIILLAFLWFSISWRNQKPVAIEAEIWAAPSTLKTVQTLPDKIPPASPIKTTPTPVQKTEPKPIAKSADINLKREKTPSTPKPKEVTKPKEDKDKTKEIEKKIAEQKRLDQLHAANVRRLMGENNEQTKPASQGRANDSAYSAQIALKIKSNTVFTVPSNLVGNPAVQYDVALLPDGSIASLNLKKSSGIPLFDQAVERAIRKSQPFPPDKSGTIPKQFPVTHRPKEE